MMDQNLKPIFFDPKHPAAYGGVESLYRASKQEGKKYTRKQIETWLKRQDVYTLHRPVRRKFQRRKIIVSGMDDQWQADLVDVSKLKRDNDGTTFLLTTIDILSKKAWVVPLRNKTGVALVQAFQTIFKEGRVPKKLNTDQGTEFLNRNFQTFLKKKGILFFTSKNETKCAVIERFNRTLRSKLWKHMEAKQTRRYLDALPSLVWGYNHAWHSSIKRRPVDVNPQNEGKVWETLYASTSKRPRYTLAVGDFVRLSKLKRTFEKGYTKNWTREIFRVISRQPTIPPVYRVADLHGEEVEGTFYTEELLAVPYNPKDCLLVERVLEEKGRGVGKRYFVKWLGYPDSFNSWVKGSDLQKII